MITYSIPFKYLHVVLWQHCHSNAYATLIFMLPKTDHLHSTSPMSCHNWSWQWTRHVACLSSLSHTATDELRPQSSLLSPSLPVFALTHAIHASLKQLLLDVNICPNAHAKHAASTHQVSASSDQLILGGAAVQCSCSSILLKAC